MADSTRIRLPDRREQLYGGLEDATGESTTSGALDEAAETYLRLVGGGPVVSPAREGALQELLREADERGSLDAEEIASIFSDHDLPIQYEPADWSVGIDSQ